MQLLTPGNFPDYELIDCGNFEKLERFGNYVTIRPEPQAVWDKILSEREWEKTAHVKFVPKTSSSGTWKKFRDMPDRWTIKSAIPNPKPPSASLAGSGSEIVLRLALTAFKHVGVFPEQKVNWDYIAESVQMLQTEQPKVLNLFAYTGGAS